MHSITGEYGEIISPLIYFKGKLALLGKSEDSQSETYFGGELPKVTNLPESAQIQLLFNLGNGIQGIFKDIQLSTIPLIYPFMHDGGAIKYLIKDDGDIEILSILPEFADNEWPYSDYPVSFEKVSYQIRQTIDMEFDEFEDLLPQGLYPENREDIIVIIPPNSDYGVSLWGENGDDENVLCVFSISPKTGKVYADNQCS